MALINTKVKPFNASAFKDGEFIENGRSSFSTQLILLLFAQLNWAM